MKKIALFILNFNGINEIKKGSLDSISKAVKKVKNAEVGTVFLDNFSNDGSVDLVEDYFDKVAVVSTFKNEGYDRGTNIGLQLAWKLFKPDYFLLVDSDNFCEEDAYNNLFNFMEEYPEIGMAQPRVMSYENKDTLVSCGHTFRKSGGTISVCATGEPYDLLDLKSCSISSTIIRTSALLKTGLLNEVFEMYYESSDLSFRIREQGYKCACCWNAVCYNERLDGVRFKDFGKYYLMRRNLFLFWYIHDKKEYQRVKEFWKEEYQNRQKMYDDAEYIKDYANEMERRAIEEGISLAGGISQYLVIPKLDEFDKNSVCVHSMKGV